MITFALCFTNAGQAHGWWTFSKGGRELDTYHLILVRPLLLNRECPGAGAILGFFGGPIRVFWGHLRVFFLPYAKKPNHKPPFFSRPFKRVTRPMLFGFFFFFLKFVPPPEPRSPSVGELKAAVSCGPECVTWLVSNRWIEGPNGGRRSPSGPLLRLLFFLSSLVLFFANSRESRIAHLLIRSGNNYSCKKLWKKNIWVRFLGGFG